MKQVLTGAWIGALLLSLLSLGVLAYTPLTPSDSVDLNFSTGYTPKIPSDSVDLVFGEATANDTCTYVSGDWEVNISDNCTISTNEDLGVNKLYVYGDDGYFKVTGSIICKQWQVRPDDFDGGFEFFLENIQAR